MLSLGGQFEPTLEENHTDLHWLYISPSLGRRRYYCDPLWVDGCCQCWHYNSRCSQLLFPYATRGLGDLPLVVPGAVLALARWVGNGGHNSSWGPGAQYAAELRTLLVYFAAELKILLVYLSESLGRLGQNGGHWGPHFSLGRPPCPCEPPLCSTLLFTHTWCAWG